MEWLRSEFFSQFILNFSFHETKEKLHLNKKPAEEIISPHYLALTQQILWGAFFYLPLQVEKATEKEHLQREKF